MLHAHRNRGVDRGPAVIGQLRYRRKDLLQVAADMNEWRKLGGPNPRGNDRLWVISFPGQMLIVRPPQVLIAKAASRRENCATGSQAAIRLIVARFLPSRLDW